VDFYPLGQIIEVTSDLGAYAERIRNDGRSSLIREVPQNLTH
jgi:hypothetical protein